MNAHVLADAIRRKLEREFAPITLEIADESAKHAGHAGARAQGESHYHITIVSNAFTGLTRLERQRRVYEALKEEISGGVHALSLVTLTPDEAANSSAQKNPPSP